MTQEINMTPSSGLPGSQPQLPSALHPRGDRHWLQGPHITSLQIHPSFSKREMSNESPWAALAACPSSPRLGNRQPHQGSAGEAGTERSVTVRGSFRSNLFRDKS